MTVNEVILREWACWHWLQHLERENPGVPGLSTKAFPTDNRSSLEFHRELWRMVAQETGMLSCASTLDRNWVLRS